MKYKIALVTVGLVLIAIVRVNAQDVVPCDGLDPDITCPLDTWVMLLMAAFSAFPVYALLKKRKSRVASTTIR